MKKICALLAVGIISAANIISYSKEKVTISGSVKFTEPNFKIQLIQPSGFDKVILGETIVNPDNTYSIEVEVDKPYTAILDCGHWQNVRVWLENEDLNINFRGMDTARVKIKNPPYVYINGGKNNELMNWMNFESYRNYQNMIAVSQAAYRSKFENDAEKQKLSMSLYGAGDENTRAHMRYLAEHYNDRNSVMAVIERLNPQTDSALIEETLAKVEKMSPVSKQLVDDYRQAETEKRLRTERMKIGNPAPHFVAYSPDGKKVSPRDFKGKVLVIDFWASWCGPCRAETPNLKNIYNEYKGKNVEFLSISIDENEEAWKKAMKEDGATWPQARTSDVGKEVMGLYQFSGIPFILVVDADGNLYRKYVRGEAIKTAVEDALSGKPAEEKKVTSIGAAMM